MNSRSKAVLLTAALAAPASASGAQAQEPGPLEPEPVLTPVSAVDPSGASDEAAPERPEEGEHRFFELTGGQPVELDDSIPLPIEATYKASDAGDELLTEASGDPFFLGFIGGKYYPPADEILDPSLVAAAGAGHMDARPDAVTYGFVMFSKRITDERKQTLERLGCRVLGFHPHYTVKVAVPTHAIGELSVLDFVRWVGVGRPEQKVHPATTKLMDLTPAGELPTLFVSVFEGDDMTNAVEVPFGAASSIDADGTEAEYADSRSRLVRSNGWMQSRLEQLGAEVVHYAERQRTFQVRAGKELLDTIAGLDFVQFVEPAPIDQLDSPAAPARPHDESRAMIGGDRLTRDNDGSTNFDVVMGMVDSGLETAHWDLNVNAFGWNCTTESSAWDDIANGGDGHGTHVAGTLFGRGVAEADHIGNAAGLGDSGTNRIYNYRRFPNPCSVSLDVITGTFSNSYTDGAGNTTRKPHVINNSWSSTYTLPHTGTEYNARVSDDAVFDEDQVWVWSAGNGGPGASTVSSQAAAKNSLTVGNVVDYISPSVGDPGNLWSTSSRGPTADGRWKPTIAAPGNEIRSCLADDNDGYVGYSGTSMSAPHVAGGIALLMDRSSNWRDRPERVHAALMASAITDDDTTLTTPGTTHLDLYGAGRFSAYKAAFSFGGNSMSNWTWQNSGASWTFGDFTVPSGCTRIVAVMAALEESASAGASSALINDWDFYLDRDPIDPAGNTGEYSAQQSSINNNEIRIINNPAPGPWRWKVYPDSVSTSTKIGVSIFFIVDDTTPDATMNLSASDSYVQPNDDVDVTASVDVDEYVGSAIALDRSGSSATLVAATSTLIDNVVTDLTDNWSGGADLTLGDIPAFWPRAATWTLRYATEGTKSITVNARSDNMVDKTATVNVIVDGTQPGPVGALQSSSHTPNQWSNDPTITYTWTAATDNLSGLDGYGIFETSSASSPGAIKDINAVTSYTSGVWPSSVAPRWFNIRSVDRSGNWDTDYRSTGPYFIDVTEPSLPTFQTSSHQPGVSRCDRDITVRWNAGTDAHSGVDGYGIFWTTSPGASPSDILDTTATVSTTTLPPGTWYLNIKTVDEAGNWTSGFESFGPFIISPDCGTNYCSANPTSTGLPASIRALGSDEASDNDLTIEAYDVPLNTFGLLATSGSAGFLPNPGGSQGNLCLGNPIGRYNNLVQNSGATGSMQFPLDLTMTPTSTGMTSVLAGETRHWQVWFRDVNPLATSNFTDGLRVRFY